MIIVFVLFLLQCCANCNERVANLKRCAAWKSLWPPVAFLLLGFNGCVVGVSAGFATVINDNALCIGNELEGDDWHADQGNLLGQVEHVTKYLTTKYSLNEQNKFRDANERVMRYGGGYADIRTILDIDGDGEQERHYDCNYDDLPGGKLGAYYDWVDHVKMMGDKIQRCVYEQIGARDRRMNGHPADFQPMLVRLADALPDGNHAHAVHIDGLDPEATTTTTTTTTREEPDDYYGNYYANYYDRYRDYYNYHYHRDHHGWLVSFAITKDAGTMIVTEKANGTQTFGNVGTQKRLLEEGVSFNSTTMEAHTCNGILLFKESQPHATRHKPTYTNAAGQTIDKFENAMYLSAFQLPAEVDAWALQGKLLQASIAKSRARLAEHTNRQRKRHMKENSAENPRRTVDEKRRRVEGREHERLQPVLRRQKLRQLELEQLKVRQNLQDQQRTLERLRRENFGALLLFAPVGLVLIYFWVCGLFERNCRSIRRCLCTCYHADFYALATAIFKTQVLPLLLLPIVSLFVYLFLYFYLFLRLRF